MAGSKERLYRKFNTTLDIKRDADCVDDLDFDELVKDVTKGK